MVSRCLTDFTSLGVAVVSWIEVSFTMKKKLDDLFPQEYEHPFDTKALDALQGTPGLEMVVRQFVKHGIERIVAVQCTGSNLRVTEQNYPEIYDLLTGVCETINLPDRPALYLEWSYDINASTIGIAKPIVVITSGAIDMLSHEELLFLVGHEIGHVKSRHMLYHLMAQVVPHIGHILGVVTLGIGQLLSTPLQYALLKWSRMSEFTADRAGLLACQDVEVATSVMVKWGGVPRKYFDDINREQFIQQAREFKRLDYDKLGKMIKFVSIMGRTHPWTVMRAAELFSWIESKEYEAVLNRETRHKAKLSDLCGLLVCRTCNYRLKGDESYCTNCGSQLEDVVT